MYIQPSFSLTRCQICAKPSHGNHFGAISCRACSAFFRRAVLKNYSNLKCQIGSGKCESDVCKRCRLEKCLQAGMSDKRFQLDHDLISSTCKNVPPSIEYFLRKPIFISFFQTETPESERHFVDFTDLIEKATNLLKFQGKKLYVGMNTLNQLTYALTQNAEKNEPILCQKIGKNDVLKNWETSFLRVADWLTYCDKFQELPIQMRLQFLKTIWVPWMRLNKNTLTANRKRLSKGENKILYFSDDCLIDLENVDFDISWITTCKIEQLKCFMNPLGMFNINSFIDPLVEFQPSNQELTYMLAILSFRYAARTLGEEFKKLNDKMVEVLADDLHSYYKNERKLKNYAGRIAKMIQILNHLERDVLHKIEKVQLARIFNLFLVDFSHPDIVFDSK